MLKKSLRHIFSALVFFQSLLIVSGGAVRLTGSGLGCPTWPTCTGNSYTPVPHQAQGQLHAWIEFGNRLIAWLIFIFAVLALIGIVRHLKNRNDYRRLRTLALLQLLGFVAQAILGGITVLTKLNPITVSAHFLLSVPLVSGAISLRNGYLYRDYFEVGATTKLFKNIYMGATVLLLVVGTVVTGSGPLSGDVAARRYPFDVTIIARLHSYVAILTLISLIGLYLSIRVNENESVKNGVEKLLALSILTMVIQGVIGYRQFSLGLPEILVGLHLLGATITWILAWNTNLRIRKR